jgi:hypothetical protein
VEAIVVAGVILLSVVIVAVSTIHLMSGTHIDEWDEDDTDTEKPPPLPYVDPWTGYGAWGAYPGPDDPERHAPLYDPDEERDKLEDQGDPDQDPDLDQWETNGGPSPDKGGT